MARSKRVGSKGEGGFPPVERLAEVAAVLEVLPGILYPAGASQAAQEDGGEDGASKAYSIDESALGGKRVEFSRKANA
jgi:hypothetical protein